jgi:hypothetical protein
VDNSVDKDGVSPSGAEQGRDVPPLQPNLLDDLIRDPTPPWSAAPARDQGLRRLKRLRFVIGEFRHCPSVGARASVGDPDRQQAEQVAASLKLPGSKNIPSTVNCLQVYATVHKRLTFYERRRVAREESRVQMQKSSVCGGRDSSAE